MMGIVAGITGNAFEKELIAMLLELNRSASLHMFKGNGVNCACRVVSEKYFNSACKTKLSLLNLFDHSAPVVELIVVNFK